MKAIICKEFAPLDALEYGDIAAPEATGDNVLIKVEAAGVNYPDGLLVQGLYQMRPEHPFVPGMEAAGTVVAVGPDASGIAVGSRVATICSLGGYAEMVAAPRGRVFPIGDMDSAEVCALMVAFGTSHHALKQRANLQPGETLLVTGAAGATGIAAIQIGKIMGCRVIGTAGSDEKCAHLINDLGFDAAINYKTANLDAALDEAAPNGIDIYFENTGGPVTDAVYPRLNLNARIPLCGLIAHYNDEETGEGTPGPKNFQMALMRRALIKGFIVIDYLPRFPEGIAAMAGWLAEGKLQYRTDMVDGLENAVEGVNRLFDGANTGKLLVRCSEAPATP